MPRGPSAAELITSLSIDADLRCGEPPIDLNSPAELIANLYIASDLSHRRLSIDLNQMGDVGQLREEPLSTCADNILPVTDSKA